MNPDSLARTTVSPKRSDWRTQLRMAVRDPAELVRRLGLPTDTVPNKSRFPLLVPEAWLARIEVGRADDPLLRQVLPDAGENVAVSGYSDDPVGDRVSVAGRGVLHKYHGRLLLITTGACAVHCRYCFRQAFPYATEHAGKGQWREAIDTVAADSSIEEVILSGGDPLMLSTQRLRELSRALAEIPHVRRLRIHSRLPVVLPDRITANLLDWLENLPWPVVLVIHANHPQEFDADVDQSLGRLRAAGVHLLNQAVLLRGVNDSADTLAALMERSFAAGALPYYLHLLDPVSGASRFEIEAGRAVELVDELRQRLSGYLVPKLVQEQPGAPSKTPLL